MTPSRINALSPWAALEGAVERLMVEMLIPAGMPDLPVIVGGDVGYAHAAALGGLRPWRAVRDGSPVHGIEIARNVLGTDPLTLLALIAHELCHVWEAVDGALPMGGRDHHGEGFRERMMAIGLMPSSTGLPGGRSTGSAMRHFVVADHPFHLEAVAMVSDGWSVPVWGRQPGGGVATRGLKAAGHRDGLTFTDKHGANARRRHRRRDLPPAHVESVVTDMAVLLRMSVPSMTEKTAAKRTARCRSYADWQFAGNEPS